MRARGHTLIEVVISVAVLTIVTLGILAGLGATRSVTIQSEDFLNATSRAERAMEAILALPFDQMRLQDGATFSIDDMSLPAGQTNIGLFEIKPVPGTSEGVYSVKVTVDFPGVDGRPGFRVELETRRSAA